jgi:hypothetical protein
MDRPKRIIIQDILQAWLCMDVNTSAPIRRAELLELLHEANRHPFCGKAMRIDETKMRLFKTKLLWIEKQTGLIV